MATSKRNPRWMYRCPHDGHLHSRDLCPDHPRAELERVYVEESDDPTPRKLTQTEEALLEKGLRGNPPKVKAQMRMAVLAITDVLNTPKNLRFMSEFQGSSVQRVGIDTALLFAPQWISKTKFGGGLSQKTFLKMSALSMRNDFGTWFDRFKRMKRPRTAAKRTQQRHAYAEQQLRADKVLRAYARTRLRLWSIPGKSKARPFALAAGRGSARVMNEDPLIMGEFVDRALSLAAEANRELQGLVDYKEGVLVVLPEGQRAIQWAVDKLGKEDIWANLMQESATGTAGDRPSPWVGGRTEGQNLVDMALRLAKGDKKLARQIDLAATPPEQLRKEFGYTEAQARSVIAQAKQAVYARVQHEIRDGEKGAWSSHAPISDRGHGPASDETGYYYDE